MKSLSKSIDRVKRRLIWRLRNRISGLDPVFAALTSIAIVCGLGFISIWSSVNPDDRDPEILGFFMEGILFVGAIGLVQYISRRSQQNAVRKALVVPLAQLSAELVIRYLSGYESETDVRRCVKDLRSPLLFPGLPRDPYFDRWRRILTDDEARSVIAVARRRKNNLESFAPAAATVGAELLEGFNSIINLLEAIIGEPRMVNRTTIAEVIHLCDCLGAYPTPKQLREAKHEVRYFD